MKKEYKCPYCGLIDKEKTKCTKYLNCLTVTLQVERNMTIKIKK